jgi:septal ring factor EnvC (AmiA/AmiB activator)
MEKTMKRVLVVLIMMNMGEAKDDLENVVMEMKMEMNERIALLEEKQMKTQDEYEKTQEELKKTQMELKKTQTELHELKTKDIRLEELLRMNEDDLNASKDDLTAIKDDLAATKNDLTATKDDLTATKDDLTATKDDLTATKDDLTFTKEDLLTKDQELEMDMSFLKEPPFFHACGYQDGASTNRNTIPYSSLLYSSTNTEGGGLDVSTGIFSSPYPGSWTVTWSLRANDDAGDSHVEIYLRKNAENIDESRHYSWYSGSSQP